MTLVTIAAIALIGTMLMNQKSPKKIAQQTFNSQVPGGHSLTRPTQPSQMWVDRPHNTILRNDAQSDNVHGIDAYLRGTYTREAAVHPGVRLVAGQAF